MQSVVPISALKMLCLAAAAVAAVGMFAPRTAAGLADSIDQKMRAIERSLCKKMKSSKCRSGKSARRKASTTSTRITALKREAAADAPIPLPRPNPFRNKAEASIEPVKAPPVIPIPRDRPESIAAPKMDETKVVSLAPPPQKSAVTEMGSDCHRTLASLGVEFSAKPTTVAAGACSVTDPVELKSLKLGAGQVDFPDQPILNCTFAVQFARWLDARGAAAAAKAGSPLAKLYTGPGYECRGRNGDASAKISEHGYGNAVDITFFKLKDGTTIQVRDAQNTAAKSFAALGEMRRSACEYFTTVLGPGANEAHAEHFHFDGGKHGSSGTYRICQ